MYNVPDCQIKSMVILTETANKTSISVLTCAQEWNFYVSARDCVFIYY